MKSMNCVINRDTEGRFWGYLEKFPQVLENIFYHCYDLSISCILYKLLFEEGLKKKDNDIYEDNFISQRILLVERILKNILE